MALASQDRRRLTPNSLALADEGHHYTWLQVDEILNRATNALLSHAFGPDRRIAVFAGNSTEAVLAYLAALHAGVSAVPVNTHLKEEELLYIVQESGTEILFVSPETVEIGQRVAELQTGLRLIGWNCGAQAGLTDWQEWLNQSNDAEPPTDMEPRPYLQFTSGTTGFPKAIDAVESTLPRAQNIAEFFDALREMASARPEGPHLTLGPLYFNASLTSVRVFGAGHPLIVAHRFDAENALRLIDHYKIVTTLMVPTHFKRLLSLPQNIRDQYDVGSVKGITHTGAACPRDVKQAMIDWFGPVFLEAYGGTESGTTNLIYSDEWLTHPGSVGKTIEPFELEIYGEDGERLPPGQAGQIFFRDKRGRGIVYRNDPEKTRAAHRESGVFTLGDVGYVDDEGYLYITDRVADMIVSGGVNIYPAEIEQILLTHPDVADAAVIGVPNADLGEEAKALVVARDADTPPDVASLMAFLKERLATYKWPRSIDIVGDVGRNPAGKINKRNLKAPYWPSGRMIG